MSTRKPTETDDSLENDFLLELHKVLDSNLNLKDVQEELTVHLKCFSGQEAVNVLNANDDSTSESMVTMQQMLNAGLMVPVFNGKRFFDLKSLYRLRRNNGTPTAQLGVKMFLNSLEYTSPFVSWSEEDEVKLFEAVSKVGEHWSLVSGYVRTKSADECQAFWEEKKMQGPTASVYHTRKVSDIKPLLQRATHIIRLGHHKSEAGNDVGKMKKTQTMPNRQAIRETEKIPPSFGKKLDRQSLNLKSRLNFNKVAHSISSKDMMSLGEVDDRVVFEPKKSLDPNEEFPIMVNIIDVQHGPAVKTGIRETNYFIRVHIKHDGPKRKVATRPVIKRTDNSIHWSEILDLGTVKRDQVLEFRLYAKHRLIKDQLVGSAKMTVGYLAGRPMRDIVLIDKNDNVLMDDSNELNLTQVKVGVVRNMIPSHWPSPVVENTTGYAYHMMVFTRGTRGDIQPFLALCRGLCNMYNFMITIVTELRYFEYVKSNAGNLTAGRIRFRVSGGDTQKRVDSRIAKFAIGLESDTMQHIMLGNSEKEFFDSEPAFHYWARSMNPDAIMFGFTLPSIAMIVSESLNIPIIGFILQPTSIPSSRYPPVVTLDEEAYEKLRADEKKLESAHARFSNLKQFVENNPVLKMFLGSLNSMRKRRGLDGIQRHSGIGGKHKPTNTFDLLQSSGVPLICPIHEEMFGGLPPDWAPTSYLTNYIFLRGDTVPPLSESHLSFISQARKLDRKLIVLAFSSMPVEKLDILRIAVKIVEECQKEVCIFALIGDHVDDPGHDAKLEAKVASLEKTGRILVDKGASFGRLFPKLDCIVAHGGLGTTGEAIMSGVPVVTTGVLLMDQRFWGSRCHDLKVGPFPIHIHKFLTSCVSVIDKALQDHGEWGVNAKAIGARVEASLKDDPSGVKLNSKVVVEQLKVCPVFNLQGAAKASTDSFLHQKKHLETRTNSDTDFILTTL